MPLRDLYEKHWRDSAAHMRVLSLEVKDPETCTSPLHGEPIGNAGSFGSDKTKWVWNLSGFGQRERLPVNKRPAPPVL